MQFEHHAQVPDGCHQECTLDCAGDDIVIPLKEIVVDLLRILQLFESHVDCKHHLLEITDEAIEIIRIEILEVQVDDGIGVLVRIVWTELGDLQVGEAVPLSGVLDVQIRVQHAHVQGLPEPARTGYDRGQSRIPQHHVYERALVHEIKVAVPQFPEIVVSDWHALHVPAPAYILRERASAVCGSGPHPQASPCRTWFLKPAPFLLRFRRFWPKSRALCNYKRPLGAPAGTVHSLQNDTLSDLRASP